MSRVATPPVEGPIYLLQLTDCHLMPQPGVPFRGIDSDATLAAVVAEAAALGIDFDRLLLSGDLVHHGGPDAYRRLLALIEPLPGVRHWIPGNHDEPAAMRAAAALACGQERVDCGRWSLLLLDSTAHPDGRGGGSLSEASLSWLQSALEQTADRHVLIALHHNPVGTDSAWQDAIMLGNADRFAQLVGAYPQVRAILCGHLHQQQARRLGTVPVFCAPATSVQFKPAQAELALEDDAQAARPGFSWYRLGPDGSVSAHPCRIGAVAPAAALG
jgi:Icc protein